MIIFKSGNRQGASGLVFRRDLGILLTVERHHADSAGGGCQTVCISVKLVFDSDFSSRGFFMNQFASGKSLSILLYLGVRWNTPLLLHHSRDNRSDFKLNFSYWTLLRKRISTRISHVSWRINSRLISTTYQPLGKPKDIDCTPEHLPDSAIRCSSPPPSPLQLCSLLSPSSHSPYCRSKTSFKPSDMSQNPTWCRGGTSADPVPRHPTSRRRRRKLSENTNQEKLKNATTETDCRDAFRDEQTAATITAIIKESLRDLAAGLSVGPGPVCSAGGNWAAVPPIKSDLAL